MYPVGNLWYVGDSKTDGVTDAPGSCGPRDPSQATTAPWGATPVGTLTGGADGAGGVLTPCPISGLALAHDGHPGIFISTVTASAPGWFGAIATPRVAVLYIGTNDLIAIANQSPGFNTDRMYSDFVACLATCLGLSPTTTWFICTLDLMPAIVAVPNAAAALFAFNAFVRAQVQQCQRQGKQVYLIDLASAPGITYNAGGVHQNVAGYAATGVRMVAALQTLRPAG